MFDAHLLLVPNLSPRIAGRRLRRSDMIWSAVARFDLGRRVAQLPLFVEHDRAGEPARGLDPDKLFDDVLGYAFFRAFEAELATCGTVATVADDAARARIRGATGKHARERLAELRLSSFRSRGAARSIERLLDAGDLPGIDAAAEAGLRTLCRRVATELADDAIRALADRVHAAVEDRGFDAFLRGLVVDARTFRTRTIAERRSVRRMDAVLGAGSEGIVFRAGDRVVKVFDGWSELDRRTSLPNLHALVASASPGALPRVLHVDHAASPVLVESEWAPTERLGRPDASELVALLRALRRAGWAMTNLAPENLRRAGGELRVIDVGRSLVRWSPELEETMAREAWLLLHHHDAPDRPELVRRSRTRADLPQLAGADRLLAAVRDEPKERLDDVIAEAVARIAPRRVLDFGCGKPRAWQRLAQERAFIAYDPDAKLRARWRSAAPDIPFVHDVADLDGQRFDAVICSLVLCCLGDEDARAAARRLRRALPVGGTAIVAVCDPRSVHVARTSRHTRLAPADARYEDHFAYEKRVDEGGTRVEHHRPLEATVRLLRDGGFRVRAQRTVDGVDLATWRDVPEFVVLELEATPMRAMPRRRAPLSGLTTICYHRVADGTSVRGPRLDAWDARCMVVSTSTLERHVRDACGRFEIVRLADVARAAERGDPLPPRSLLVTVDDGYRDAVETIAPALERFRVPATLFVRQPTGDGLPTWAPLDLLYAAIGSVAPTAGFAPPTGAARERLLDAGLAEQLAAVASIALHNGVDVRELDRADVYASERDLRALRARGVSLAAHGVEHVRWTTLGHRALGVAAHASARWTSSLDAAAIAYPDAAMTARTARAAARHGFALGFGLEPGAPPGAPPALVIPRVVARDEVGQIEALARRAEEER